MTDKANPEMEMTGGEVPRAGTDITKTDNDEIEIQPGPLWLFNFVKIILFVCGTASLFYTIYGADWTENDEQDCYDDYACYRGHMSFFYICYALALIAHTNQITYDQDLFCMFKGSGREEDKTLTWFVAITQGIKSRRTSILAFTFLLGIVDYVLLDLSTSCEAQGFDMKDHMADCKEPPINVAGAGWRSWDEPDAPIHPVKILTRVLTFSLAIISNLAVLAYWDSISFQLAHQPFLHAFFWLFFPSAGVMWFARKLRPPEDPQFKKDLDNPRWSWHTYHPKRQVLSYCMALVFIGVSFVVHFSAIMIALFAELGNASEDVGGVVVAVVLYVIIAIILGILPVAPGTLADIMGGFLVIKILMNGEENDDCSYQLAVAAMTPQELAYDAPSLLAACETRLSGDCTARGPWDSLADQKCTANAWSFGTALLFTIAIVTFCHFAGSCLQWVMGMHPAFQQWGNDNMPVDMLAATDTALAEAGCIEVGIVGQLFADTMNGLNQGRMGMAFCTQFWSEYASMPGAIAWVITGGVLSQSGSGGDSKLATLAPITLLLATLIQIILQSYAAGKIATGMQSNAYWTQREKWSTAQWFTRKGIRPTVEGWKADCFYLYQTLSLTDEDKKAIENETNKKVYVTQSIPSLFDRIYNYHVRYVTDSKKATEEGDALASRIATTRYSNQIESERELHYRLLLNKCFKNYDPDNHTTALEIREPYKKFFVTFDPAVDTSDDWKTDWRYLPFVQEFFVVIAAVVGAGTYWAFGDIGVENGISEGFAVLKHVKPADNPTNGWLAFALFNLIYVIYYHKAIWYYTKTTFVGIFGCLTCCCKEKEQDPYDGKKIETTYQRTWAVPYEENDDKDGVPVGEGMQHLVGDKEVISPESARAICEAYQAAVRKRDCGGSYETFMDAYVRWSWIEKSELQFMHIDQEQKVTWVDARVTKRKGNGVFLSTGDDRKPSPDNFILLDSAKLRPKTIDDDEDVIMC